MRTSLTRAWLVARKTLLEYLREAQLLGLTLALPLFFLLIAAVGYGTAPRLATFAVLISDSGGRAGAWIERLAAERYADGRPVFRLSEPGDPVQAEAALKDKSAAVWARFGLDAGGQVNLILRGDATSMAYLSASSRLAEVLGPLFDAQSGKPQVLRMDIQPLSTHAPQSEFEAYAPGMIIFGILMLLPQTAMFMGRELRGGTLRRLRLTPVKPIELLAGVSLAQMILAVFQVGLMCLAALAFGFQIRGSLGLLMLICLLLCSASVGMGLLMAAFAHNDSDALNTGSAISMLQVFLSGAFFAMPAPEVFNLWGHSVGAFDFVPATHAMLALQQVMTGGAGLAEVAFRLAAVALLSLVYFGVSVWIFGRLKMRAE